jgi:apolipoprotein D and lipocalin family protein
MKIFRGLAALLAAVLGTGCATAPPTIPPVERVDVSRFAGRWYVIAHIPSRPERDAYNAVETYAPPVDGVIETTFTFNEGAFDGPEKVMRPTGFVREDGNGAVWGMQFVWPIKAEYVIVDLDADYTRTIVGRSKRDYAWIMARTPTIPDADYQAALDRLVALGYSLENLRKVPQRWPAGTP